jgi:3-hydroxyisobutyrate dehydrogenase-like beta-hydroxyacid dehydrogenase
MGPVGRGALTKLAINLGLFGNALALAEGLPLGMKAGIDAERLLSVVKDGAGGSKVMAQKGRKMVQAEYSVEGPGSRGQKDGGWMLEQGRGLGSPMFLTSTLAQLIGNGMRQLDPSQDYASFIELSREMAGLDRRS